MEKKTRFTLRGLRSHKRFCRMVAGASSFLTLVPMSVPAFAAGTDVLGGDSVLSGATGANLAQNTDAYAQFVSSGGSTAVLDWTKFNVGAGKEMNFDGSGTTFFNLVDGAASKSQIDGLISGNGSVWVINPNGIAFGASAQVNVGGLFAAAAGNISNAADLRNGTTSNPGFSSFDGTIETKATVSGGKASCPIFNAGKTQLIGKSVNLGGAISGELAVQAGSSLKIDDIGGGAVFVDPAQFVDGEDVSLGDLGVVVYGNLAMSARGNVEQTGAISVAGSSDICAAGDVVLNNLNNNFCAQGGYVSALGDSVTLADSNGIRLGTVTASRGDVNVATYSGDVNVLKGAVVETLGKGKGVKLQSSLGGVTGVDASGVHVTEGDVSVNGVVMARGDDGYVTLKSGSTTVFGNGAYGSDGNVVVGETGGVAAHKVTASAVKGDATVNGMIIAVDQTSSPAGSDTPVVQYGSVEITAGQDEVTVRGQSVQVIHSGNVNVAGVVQGGTVSMNATKGNVNISGTLTAEKQLAADTGNGDITVEKDATLKSTADNSLISLSSSSLGRYVENGETRFSDGDVVVNGKIVAEGKGSSVYLHANGNVYGQKDDGSMVASKGDVFVNGSVTAENQVELETVFGNVSVDGTVAGGSLVEARTGVGDIEFGGHSEVTAGKTATGTSGEVSGTVSALAGMLGLEGSVNVKAIVDQTSGDVVDRGELVALGENGKVAVCAGFAQGATGSVTMNGRAAAEGANGEVRLAAGYGGLIGSSGDATVGGEVVGGKNVQLDVYQGTMSIAEGAQVRTTENGSKIHLQGGMKANAESAIKIDGTLEAGGDNSKVMVNHGYAKNAHGTITVGEKGKVSATGENGFVRIATGIYASNESYGDIRIDGTVSAKNNVDIEAGVGLSDSEDTALGTRGSLTLDSHANVSSAGEMVKLATYDGDITVNKGAKVAATAEAGQIVLQAGDKENGKGDIRMSGNLTASGNSSFNANGEIVDHAGVSLFVGARKGSTGNITIGADGLIETSGKGSLVQIVTETENAEVGGAREMRGDIDIQGTVKATGDKSQVFVWGGFGDYTKGNVSISGSVTAEGKENELKVWAGRGVGCNGNMDISGTIAADGDNSLVYLFASRERNSVGDINVAETGRIHARGYAGKVELSAAKGANSRGSINFKGIMDASSRAYISIAHGDDSVGSLDFTGDMYAGFYMDELGTHIYSGDITPVGMIVAAGGNRANANVAIAGSMVSMGSVSFTGALGDDALASFRLCETGLMMGGYDAHIRSHCGVVEIAGDLATVASGSQSAVLALDGAVRFIGNGRVSAGNSVTIIASGDIMQEGGNVAVYGGRAMSYDFSPVVSAKEVNLKSNGSVGGSDGGYLALSGDVRAIVSGDARLAAAEKGSFSGSNKTTGYDLSRLESLKTSISEETKGDNLDKTRAAVKNYSKIFSEMEGSVDVGGNLSVYTADKLEPNGLLKAGGNLTVSAASFDSDAGSYMQAGGLVTINNVGKVSSPQIVILHTLDGVDPQINNQPNDVVIFVDGRLAGGNLKILNQFGANEAFMVSTPELKSTQGIFGNPPFLHSDLDVANPMEVSAIDYMLQETPRLTLDKDFPPEVDSHVDSVVVPEKDSIQFGREAENEDAADEPRVETASTSSLDGKVALMK